MNRMPLTRTQHGLTISFLEDVWTRNFANLFAGPLRMREYLAGLMMTSMMNGLLALATVSVLGWLLFAFNIFRFGLLLVPFVAVLTMIYFVLAVAIFAFVFRRARSRGFLVQFTTE